MTDLLYFRDHYLRECDAEVVDVMANKIELDKTVFYPEGGGQPCDTGKLTLDGTQFNLTFVKKESGKVLHHVDREGLKKGDNVHCIIDWERRYKLMRFHTASHILSGIFSKEYGAKITGNQIKLDECRVDFDLEKFDREVIDSIIKKGNELVEQSLPVTIKFMERSEVEANPSLIKLAMGLPPNIQTLRMICIGDFDMQPDGGTHVANTSEIGKIVFLRAENKGKNNRRVYFGLEK